MIRFTPLLAPIGAALFTLAWLVLGWVSPGYRLFDLVIEPYSPVSQPISGLGLGLTGPFMNAAFVIGGVLIVVGVTASLRGLPRSRTATVGLVLTAFVGAGMIIDGLFTLESVMLHLTGFLLAIPVPALGFALLGIALWRSNRRLAVGLIVSAALSIALFVTFMVTFDPYSAGDNSGVSGLLQRVLVTVVLVSVSAVAITAHRTTSDRRG